MHRESPHLVSSVCQLTVISQSLICRSLSQMSFVYCSLWLKKNALYTSASYRNVFPALEPPLGSVSSSCDDLTTKFNRSKTGRNATTKRHALQEKRCIRPKSGHGPHPERGRPDGGNPWHEIWRLGDNILITLRTTEQSAAVQFKCHNVCPHEQVNSHNK